MYLISGLGNPGRRYARTRHNVGFMLVDRLARHWDIQFGSFSRNAETARYRSGELEVILVKPQSYMNLSGDAVAELVRYYRLEPASCLVVYDEIALALGRIRFRASGSAGGHRGMQSVIDRLGTADVPRLRIGVGPDREVPDLADFVLSNFDPGEMELLDQTLARCQEGVEVYLQQGMEPTMARFN